MPHTSQPGTPVTSRALTVLAAFDRRHRRLSLSDLARRSGLPLTTTHRLVAALVDFGALAKSADGRYEIGRKLWEIGLLAPVAAELSQVAAPYLQDVFSAVGEAVYLAVRQETAALYLDRIVGTVAPRLIAQAGTRLPLHATGVGKALLAHAPPDVLERVLAGGLPRYTPNTVTTERELIRELAQVRRRGFARTHGELSLGSAAVAVPVMLPDLTVTAAIGVVTGSTSRDLSRMVPTLGVAARGLGRALGDAALHG